MERIQRKRTKGWRSPPKTRFCGRPTVYANHYKIVFKGVKGFVILNTINDKEEGRHYATKAEATKRACELHSFFLHRKYQTDDALREFLEPLRAYDYLSCFCSKHEQCHVDYLIVLIRRLWDE